MGRSRAKSDAICFLGDAPLQRLEKKQLIFIVYSDPKSIDPAIKNHPRAHLYFLATPLMLDEIIKTIAWSSVMLELQIVAKPGWEEAAKKLKEFCQAADLLLSEVADLGKEAFFNAYRNWTSGQIFHDWHAMQGCFHKIPAIICGAGPSLSEAAPHLHKYQDKALICAAGTATALLSSYSITPHLAFSLDKTENPSFWMEAAPEIPVCVQSRLAPRQMQWIHGRKILAPESGPIPWEKWWLDREETVELGWTAGNFATQSAVWMGCDPIIWVGMDLCYRRDQKYAKRFPHDKVPLIEYRGHQTQHDWIMAARWSEELAENHPEIQFINTAVKGLPLNRPIEKKSLRGIKLQEEFDVAGRLHQILASKKLLRYDLGPKEKKWKKSIERSKTFCSDPRQDRDKMLAKEPIYHSYLESLWRIWHPIVARETAGQNLDWHRRLFFQHVLNELYELHIR